MTNPFVVEIVAQLLNIRNVESIGATDHPIGNIIAPIVFYYLKPVTNGP